MQWGEFRNNMQEVLEWVRKGRRRGGKRGLQKELEHRALTASGSVVHHGPSGTARQDKTDDEGWMEKETQETILGGQIGKAKYLWSLAMQSVGASSPS